MEMGQKAAVPKTILAKFDGFFLDMSSNSLPAASIENGQYCYDRWQVRLDKFCHRLTHLSGTDEMVRHSNGERKRNNEKKNLAANIPVSERKVNQIFILI